MTDPLHLFLENTPADHARADSLLSDYCGLLEASGVSGPLFVSIRTICDGCGVKQPDKYSTFGESWAAAQVAGWTAVGSDAFCPDCTAGGVG